MISDPISIFRRDEATASSLLTEAQAKAALSMAGLSVADWARARGFSPELTRMVLAGKRKCLRGQSHQIAVELGIKSGVSLLSVDCLY